MTSTQRFLANDRNVLLNAALAASSVASIENAVLERPLPRGGSATVAISGAYTGQDEADYEIEIVDTVADNPVISQPVFAGAGTGVMSGIGYTGSTAQAFTVKLADLGQLLTAAGTDIESAGIVARTPGADGNLIHLSVDQSGLTFTATDYSLIEDLKLGTDGIEGPQYDWDTKVMGADGQIPADAHRLAFGEDTSTVYRQYKQYKDGKWLYHFDPQLKNDFPAGTRVKWVSGGRTVTLDNGLAGGLNVVETYTGIVTLYDLLSAFQTASALVKVEGVVANDRAPGGMAARDLTTRTDAYFMPSYGKGSAFATGLVNCSVTPIAYTELVEAKCWAVSSKDDPAASVVQELWTVKGSVSGIVAEALRTGVPLITDRFSITIPSKLPNGWGTQRGRFSQIDIAYASRDLNAGEFEPPICVKKSLAIGPEAVDQTITLTYKMRPNNANCGCDGMAVPDLSKRECLTGKFDLTGGDSTMTPPHLMRATRLSIWYRDFVKSNTAIDSGRGYINAQAIKLDLDLASKSFDTLSSALNDIYTSGTLANPEWAAATDYTEGATIESLGYRYAATIAGTSGATIPDFPVLDGETVIDGGVTWECIGLTPAAMWDAAFDEVKTELDVLIGMLDTADGSVANFPPGSVDINAMTVGQILQVGDVVYNTGDNVTPGALVTLTSSLTRGTGFPIIVGVHDTLPIGSAVTISDGLTSDTIITPGNIPVGAVDLDTAVYGQVIPTGTVVYSKRNATAGGSWQGSVATMATLTSSLTIGANFPCFLNVTINTPIGSPINIIDDLVNLTPIATATYGGAATPETETLVTIPNIIATATFSGWAEYLNTPQSHENLSGYSDQFDKRYLAIMDAVRAAAGITKKADASTVAGDGCWRDNGDPYWWEVIGSVGGEYAPAFNNEPYIGSRTSCSGNYFSTHEFAFQINVKCPEGLKIGDKIVLAMGDSGWPSTYQVGDTLYLPVVAAQDLYLAGGNDGDNIQTWHVDGSVDGAFPAYQVDIGAPTAYNASGLAFTISPGGIPFEPGDQFRFAVEGGNYRWRKGSGAWSHPSPVGGGGAGGEGLSDGLSATFTPGAAPSFVTGDLYRFRALQPAALSNVINPDTESWQWDGSSATLTANLGAEKTIDCVSLAFHTLPSGATVTLSGGADGVTWDWSESITWRAGVMAKLFTAHTATWLKLAITSATGGAIGWAWAGQALSTELSAECLLRRDYSVERGAGLNPSAAFMGSTRSGEIEWQQGILTDTDLPGILAMLDHVKTNDDEPLILIPQSTRPEEAYPVRVVLDSIDMPEDGGYQPNTGNERRYGLKLSVKGVVA